MDMEIWKRKRSFMEEAYRRQVRKNQIQPISSKSEQSFGISGMKEDYKYFPFELAIRFWDDHWVEGYILKTSFSRSFALVANKSAIFVISGLWENGQWKWNVKLRRYLFDWEVEQYDSFRLTLNSVVMMATRNDKVVWSFDSLSMFSSRLFDKEMENSSYSDPILHAAWKFKAPPNARLLCWQSIVGKVPTRDVILRICIIAESQYGCPLCNSCIQSIDHLFNHYKFALSIW
ncbi:hypothetical protein CTI12_AA049660 [Artemisia annua]|uniref:Reverse transcriptase zinc-binding domain-containing protein n=1 Tax=Artemisia annua TaxID=35608 RepID=A0A2U1QC83_ARTAN|nr:hypothetical protein CTI12_AA049660 [Artemisia annua]